MKGRKKKPATLHVINGNPGKRTILNEPKAPGTLTDPPDWMSAQQKEAWGYAIKNAPANVLGRIDRGLMTAWVVAENLHRQATQALENEGLLVEVGDKGVLQQSPYLAIVNRQAQIMVKTAAELGFTPVARARMGTADGAGANQGNKFAGHGVRTA